MPSTTTENPARKSPIKDPPRRAPGQSLQEQLDDLFIQKIMYWRVMSAAFWGIAFIEIERWFFHSPIGIPSIIAFTSFALICTLIAFIKIRKIKPKLHNLRQGLDGEIFIGQFLDEHCRERGYKVLHDIQADGFNIDHLLIGPGGIFTIETKTISKPAKGEAIIQYNGTSVLINGHTPDRDPIAQANGNAAHIANLLSRSTARRPPRIPHRPVVLYPGWYVKAQCSRPTVWILNEKSFRGFLDYEDANKEAVLSKEDIAFYYTRLESQQRPPTK